MIIAHPYEQFEDEMWNRHPCLVVQCQICRALGPTANDEHGAVTKARAQGFKTVRGTYASSPRRWMCAECAKFRV